MGIKRIALFARTTVWPDKPVYDYVYDRYDEEYEMTKNGDKKITAALKKLMRPHGIIVNSFESEKFDAKTYKLYEAADEVILATDARIPEHRDFCRRAYSFLNYTEPGNAAPWAPYLLLTNADLVSSDSLKESALAIKSVWLTYVPTLSDIRCEYPVFYCSHDYNHFSLDGVNYEEGIDSVVKYMVEKQDYWNEHRRWAQGIHF